MLYFLICSGQVVYFQTVSNYSQGFFQIGVLKSFAKLTGKYLCRSCSLITHQWLLFSKTRVRHSSFIVNFVNFLKTIFLQCNFGRLLLSLSNVLEMSINVILFSQCNFSRNSLEAVVRRCSSK